MLGEGPRDSSSRGPSVSRSSVPQVGEAGGGVQEGRDHLPDLQPALLTLLLRARLIVHQRLLPCADQALRSCGASSPGGRRNCKRGGAAEDPCLMGRSRVLVYREQV